MSRASAAPRLRATRRGDYPAEMGYLLRWTEGEGESQSATTRNGRVYRVEFEADTWVAITPYGARVPCSSLIQAKHEAESLAQDLEGPEDAQ